MDALAVYRNRSYSNGERRPRFSDVFNWEIGLKIFEHLHQPLTVVICRGVCKDWRDLLELHPCGLDVLFPVKPGLDTRWTQIQYGCFEMYLRREPDEHMRCLRLWMPTLHRVLANSEQHGAIDEAIAHDKPTALAMLLGHATVTPVRAIQSALSMAVERGATRVIADVLMPACVMTGQRTLPFWRTFSIGSLSVFQWFCANYTPPFLEAGEIQLPIPPPSVDEKIVLLWNKTHDRWRISWWREWFYATLGLKLNRFFTSGYVPCKLQLCFDEKMEPMRCPETAVALVKHVLKEVPQEAIAMLKQTMFVSSGRNARNADMLALLAPWCPAATPPGVPIDGLWIDWDVEAEDAATAGFSVVSRRSPPPARVIDDIAGEYDDYDLREPRSRRPKLELQ